MKIGLLTFHRAKNYGAVLQCYALSQFLVQKGHEVSVIDYQPPYLAGMKDESSALKRVNGYLKTILYWLLNCGESQLGDGFRRFVEKRLKVISMPGACVMDAFVCGSDQIWSPKICKGFDKVYFAQIPDSSPQKVISYAASMGETKLTDGQKEEFLSLLNNFDAIGVRETSLSELLDSIGVRNAVVADPVILAGKSIFQPLLVPIRQKRPYVLIYELTPLPATYSFAQNMATQIGAEVVVIGGGADKYFRRGIKNKQGLSPEQFVSYFANASCVVTNSFHGTAFSLIYNKPFYCLRTNTWKDERILSLLQQTNLMNRFVDDSDVVNYTSIDYKTINDKLQQMRKKSEDFIRWSLE